MDISSGKVSQPDPKEKIPPQTFHAMCAWLDGYKFELVTDTDYQADKRFDSVSKQQLADSYYKLAFKTEVRVKCKYCVRPDLSISTLRRKKFEQFKLLQQVTHEIQLPWLHEESKGPVVLQPPPPLSNDTLDPQLPRPTSKEIR